MPPHHLGGRQPLDSNFSKATKDSKGSIGRQRRGRAPAPAHKISSAFLGEKWGQENSWHGPCTMPHVSAGSLYPQAAGENQHRHQHCHFYSAAGRVVSLPLPPAPGVHKYAAVRCSIAAGVGEPRKRRSVIVGHARAPPLRRQRECSSPAAAASTGSLSGK